MNINENLKKSLILANNANIITDTTFKSLLENSFNVLIGLPEPHNLNMLYNSKPDAIKELYACILSLTADLIRNNNTKENVQNYLLNECNYNSYKIDSYLGLYEKNRLNIEAALINIGNYLPHVTDISWKIDYLIKSSYLDRSDGPLFRIGLQTEKSGKTGQKDVEFIHFTCTSQELQDLVYKLKDAVRFCQKVRTEH